jgi:hypothetical protein
MSALPLLSQSTVSTDGKWEGWCWYPDQPLERAIVELFIGNRSMRAVRAARLRTDIRDLGMHDGYCGFQLPIPPKEPLSGHSCVEIRERRFGRVIGRIVSGEDGRRQAKELRLRTTAEALNVAEGDLNLLSAQLRKRTEPLEELGALLSHLSLHPERGATDLSQMGAWAVGRERMAAVPHADLGCCERPRVTLVVCSSYGGIARDVVSLAAELRAAALSMQHVGAEFILVDDGAAPLASLLPGRLRNLQIVRSTPDAPLGGALNAAALISRGTWLAFARPSAIGIAQLSDVIMEAVDGTLHVEAATTGSPGASHHHRLKALVTRSAFGEMGGFDPKLDDPALWADLAERATIVGQQLVTWNSPRDFGWSAAARGEPQHG